MILYVLVWWAYEETWPLGVYSSVEKAQKAAEKHAKAIHAKAHVHWNPPDEQDQHWVGRLKVTDERYRRGDFAIVDLPLDDDEEGE